MLPPRIHNLSPCTLNHTIIMRPIQSHLLNTYEYLIIQISIFFINKKQAPLGLYKLHTVPVPLDKDTYDGIGNKYTQVNFQNSHLVISNQEYIDISQ